MSVRLWGDEVVVNSNPTGDQDQPAVTALAGGGFVIVWVDFDPAGGDGSNTSIKMQLFDAAGNRDGGEVLVNTTTTSIQEHPDVVALTDGSFVVAWEDDSNVNGNGRDIRFRHFAGTGLALDGADRAATGLLGQQQVSLVALAGGDFAMAFNEFGAGDRDDKLIRFHGDGTPVDVTPINLAVTNDNEEAPQLAALGSGEMVGAFLDSSSDLVFLQRVGTNGGLVGARQQVSNVASANNADPAVAALANGNFVVTWRDGTNALPDDSGFAVHAQLFNANFAELGSEIVVNTTTEGQQVSPAVVAMPNGGYAIVWADALLGIKGQLFDGFGGRLGTEFNISAGSFGVLGGFPAVAALADGRLVVTWDSSAGFGGDGSGHVVKMQIIDPRDGVVSGTEAGETLYGSDLLNDQIDGRGGTDTLIGLRGDDDMRGGDGNDTYVVDSPGDRAVELAHGGSDLVMSSVSFTLGANVEDLALLSSALGGTGNSLANIITGNAAANTLDGQAGADTMLGLAGDDSYVVDDAGDVVSEAGGDGIDTVSSSIAFSLAATLGNIENLTLTGSAAINGTGNTLANVLTGNAAANLLSGDAGNDTISGGLGADTLLGGIGNDTISAGIGNAAANTLSGEAGNDAITGALGRDTISGGAGNDTIAGGLGNDRLTGGAGFDKFVFNTKPNAANNRDVVTDFNHVQDTFLLDNAIFTKLGGNGALKAGFFHVGAAAADADDHIVYNKATGALIYDVNGSAAGGAVQFATLINKPALLANDFVVI